MIGMIINLAISIGEGEIGNLPLWTRGVGYPQVPVKVITINLLPHERIKDVIVKDIKQRPIRYTPTIARVIDDSKDVPEHFSTYPERVAFIGNQGFFRGNNLAFIVVSALQIKNDTVYLNERVEFDVIKENANFNYEVPASSNPRIWGKIFNEFGIANTNGYIEDTGVDMIILTTERLKESWKPLANLHMLQGYRVKILTVEWIRENSYGRNIQEKIRNFLKFAYTNWGLSALLIGADAFSIPPIRTYVPLFSGYYEMIYGNDVLTDFYYASLDGEWDTDGNYWSGDLDSIDFVPDIMVGRFPATSPDEVESFIQNVIYNETSKSFDGISFDFFSANLFGYPTVPEDSADGCLMVYNLGTILTSFPPNKIKFVCEKDSRVITDSINSSKPSTIFFLMHANHRVLVNRNLYYNDVFEYSDIDNITTPVPLAGFAACFANEPFTNSVGKEFVMKGKAVVSIGASKADFTLSVYSLWYPLFDSLNSLRSNPTTGYIFNIMKIFISGVSYYSPLYRYLMFAYHMIGDPLTRVFTEEPPAFKVYKSVYDGRVEFTLRYLDNSPVKGALIVITDGERLISKGFTDNDGKVVLNYKSPYGDTLFWGVNVQGAPLKFGRFISEYTGEYLVLDSVYMGPGRNTILRVILSNRSQSDVIVRPILRSNDAIVESYPNAKTIPAGKSEKFEYRIRILKDKAANFELEAGDQTFRFSVMPKLVNVNFVAAKWNMVGDSIALYLDIANYGSLRSDSIRISNVFASLKGWSDNYTWIKTFEPLNPNESSKFRWSIKVKGKVGDTVKLYLFNGKEYVDVFSVVIDSVRINVDSLNAEPVNGGVRLSWVGGDSGTTWRIYVDGNPLNIPPFRGSHITVELQDFQEHAFAVSPVKNGIEGNLSSAIISRSNPPLRFARNIELINNSGSEWPYNSSPIISQLIPSTPEPEIILSSADKKIYILDIYGSILRTLELPSKITTTPISIGEYIIVGTEDESINMIHYSGVIKWRTELPDIPKYIMASKLEMNKVYVVAVSLSGSIYVIDTLNGTISASKTFLADTIMLSPPATYDMDRDGIWDIVFKVDTFVYVFDKDLNTKPGFPVVLHASLGMHYTRYMFVWDMDKDGYAEIVVCGHRNYIISHNGSVILRDSSAYYPNSYCIPGDFDGDGRYDIAFYNGREVGMYKIDSGKLVMLDTISETYPTARHPVISDIDGDGRHEIIISNAYGHLNAYSYGNRNHSGFPINLSDDNRYKNASVISAPAIINYNRNAILFAPIVGNMLFSWNIPSSYGIWEMFRKNQWATGSPISIDEIYTTTTISGVKGESIERFRVVIGRDYMEVWTDGNIEAKIYSISGRLIESAKGTDILRLKFDLPRGIYIAKVITNSGIRFYKLII